MGTLNVNVRATHSHDTNIQDNDMVLVTEVTDADGEPVTDLELKDFEVWQLGIAGFGRINPALIQHLGNVDASLDGVYHVVPKWSWFLESQIAFAVIVTQGRGGDSGRGLADLVTQGSQS